MSLTGAYVTNFMKISSVLTCSRDCSLGNIMMEASSVFPRGSHPSNIATDRGGVFLIESIPRYKAAGPIRYYLIDFDISRIYEPDEVQLYIGGSGADRDVPELSHTVAYDPFRADVFILGNVLKKHFIPVRSPSLQLVMLRAGPGQKP